MTELEQLENKVITLQYKNNLRIERLKRLRDLESPKFTEFNYGKAWGTLQALGNILGAIRQIKSKK